MRGFAAPFRPERQAPAMPTPENGFYVDFYEAAGRVKWVLSSVLFVPAVCG